MQIGKTNGEFFCGVKFKFKLYNLLSLTGIRAKFVKYFHSSSPVIDVKTCKDSVLYGFKADENENKNRTR